MCPWTLCDQGNSPGPPRRAAAETGVSPDARAVGASPPHRTPAALLLDLCPSIHPSCLSAPSISPITLLLTKTCSDSLMSHQRYSIFILKMKYPKKGRKLSPRMWRATCWLWFELSELLTPSPLHCAAQLLKISCPVPKAPQLPV